MDDRTVGERYEDRLKRYCPSCFHRQSKPHLSRCESCGDYLPFRWSQEQLEKVERAVFGTE